MAQAEIFSINVQPIVDQMKVLSTAIGQTKEQLSKLTEEEKKNTDEGIALTASLKSQEKEYRSLQTVVVNQAGAVKELAKATETNTDLMNLESNSIATNRKLYNALYGEIVNTTTATEAEQKALTKKIEKAKQINDVLKNQEKQLGDTRRNVGNYAESLQSVIGGLSNSIPALRGFEGAQKGVNLVMSANPIGGVVTLLFALKDIFSSNAMVADQLTFAFDGINQALSFVIDTIVDTVTNFDKLATAIANPFAFFANLGKGAVQAGKDGFEASKQLDILTESIGASTLAIEKNNIVIEQNKTILMNKKRTDAERKQASKEIIKLENENTEKLIANATAELNSEKLKLKSKIKNGQLSAEESQRLGLLEAKIEKTKAEGIANIRKAENENYKILYGEREELDKKNAELKNQADAKALAEKKQYDVQILGLQDEFQKNERERLEDSFNKKLDLIKGNSEAENALRLAIGQQQIEALKKFDEQRAKQVEDARKKAQQEQIAMNAEAFNKQISLNEKLLKNQLDSVDLTVASEEEKGRRKQEIQIKYLEQQLALTRAFFGELNAEEEAQLQSLQNAINKLKKEATTKAEGNATLASSIGLSEEDLKGINDAISVISAGINAIGSVLSANSEIRLNEIDSEKQAEIQRIEESGLSEENKEKKIRETERKFAMQRYEEEKKAFETNKALQIVNTIIATASAVVAQLANPTPYVGIALAAAAAVTGAAQIAVISSQKPPPPPKFAKGVIGLRGQGTETSDSIDAKLSKGESVMTARATSRFAHELAMMELAVGNRPNFQFGKGRFSTGYIPTGDGGFSARQTAQTALNNVAMAETMANAVKSMPAPVLEYSEFTRFTDGVSRSVTISEL